LLSHTDLDEVNFARQLTIELLLIAHASFLHPGVLSFSVNDGALCAVDEPYADLTSVQTSLTNA